MNEHDPLCPNIPCSCEPDDYGHEWTCSLQCSCEFIQRVRADQQEQDITAIEDVAAEYVGDEYQQGRLALRTAVEMIHLSTETKGKP